MKTKTSTAAERGSGSETAIGRRQVLQGAAVAGAWLAGCSSSPVVNMVGDAALNSPPVWLVIPDQIWQVGVPVSLDLANYASDPDGDPLTYGLDMALPPGVTLVGSLISGTPTAVFAAAPFVATADDGF